MSKVQRAIGKQVTADTSVTSLRGSLDIACASVNEITRAITADEACRNESTLVQSDITEVIFGVYGDHEIVDISVAKIVDPLPTTSKATSRAIIDDIRDNSVQYIGANVNSCRLGTWSRDVICSTCAKDFTLCPGHYGYIDLVDEYYNPLFIDIVALILTCVCQSCGSLLIPEDYIVENDILKLTGTERLKIMAEYSGFLKCSGPKAGCPNVKNVLVQGQRTAIDSTTGSAVTIVECRSNMCPKVEGTSEDGGKAGKEIVMKDPKDKKRKAINVKTVYAILQAISDKDAELLGFDLRYSHPRNLIMTKLLVIPPVCRPASTMNGVVMNDRLTDWYDAIVITRKEIADEILSEMQKVTKYEIIRELIYKIMIGGSEIDYARGGKSITNPSIAIRISKKEGLLRRNMEAKRGACTARTVLSPGSRMPVGYIGVPYAWSNVITVPICVTNFNIHKVVDMIRNGDILHILPEGTQIDNTPHVVTEDMYSELVPKVGDKVYRRLRDGDYVMFNRQPTLSKQSTMTHRAILNKNSQTFKLGLEIVVAYNADFDGDEGNGMFPQSHGAITEAANIMNVTENIIGTETNSPTVGCVYDAISGGYLMSMGTITKNAWEYCLTAVEKHDDIEVRFRRHGVQLKDASGRYYSRNLFSFLFPSTFFYHKKGDKDKNEDIIINNGILMYTNGLITSSHIGRETGSIVHEIYLQYGKDRAAEFLTSCTHIINNFLEIYGFSIGIADCKLVNPVLSERIHYRINELRVRVDAIGDLDKMDPIDRERNEEIIVLMAGGVSNVGTDIRDSLPHRHPLSVMVKSGAKGKADQNITPIMGVIGSQTLRGKRLPRLMNEGKRSTAHFPVGDNSVESRGFIPQSYYEGVTPVGSFYLMQAGREGLSDTALRTQMSGYLQRLLVKTGEACKVTNDGAVRTAGDRICVDPYGGDGLNPKRLSSVKLPNGTNRLFFIDIEAEVRKLNALFGY